MTIQNTTPAGWYPDPAGQPMQRFWNGMKWTNDTAPLTDGQHPAPQPQATGQPVYVNTIVQQPKKRVNHILHFILTLVTFGLWLPVWIILAIANS